MMSDSLLQGKRSATILQGRTSFQDMGGYTDAIDSGCTLPRRANKRYEQKEAAAARSSENTSIVA